MSNVRFDIYLQRENLHFGIKEGITLDELASVLSSFFECEENWHKMKECWLENGKSKDFQHLMKKALLGAYDTFCIDDLV
nr:MAG TPA: hypothetical protein [Caudoviricetes sp.]